LTVSSTSARWFQGTIETDRPMRMQAIRIAKHAQMIPTSRRGLSFIVVRQAYPKRDPNPRRGGRRRPAKRWV
jgi:hypothetical protein